MLSFEDLIKKFPPELRETLRFVWDSLPPVERTTLQTLLNGFPADANLIRLLLSLSATQVRLAFGQKHQVAIVGPANVGKSTLYNQLVYRKEDKARVSPVPGTTRINQTADTGIFRIIDTPGADAVGYMGDKERQQALDAAQKADFLVILFDAIQGIKRTEHDLFEQLTSLGKPYIVVLNKTDLVRKELSQVIEHVAANLSLKPEQVIPIVARDGKNISQVLMSIAVAEPEIVAALGRAMPAYRWQLAWRAIVSAASVSAVIALTPLPIIDFAPLMVNQTIMVLGIARIYNFQITLQRARELVLTFGLGFLGRTLFYELSKFGGLPGWLLAAAIASSTTVVMGYAAANWFEKGQKLSSSALGILTRKITADMLNSLKSMGKRKPGKKSLQDAITQTLESSTMSQDKQVIDQQAASEPTRNDLETQEMK